jgi:hypothetical protein
MKRCTKCNEEKPLTDYYKDKSKSDGYRTECKSCKKMYSKRFRQTEEYKNWKRKNSSAYYHSKYKHCVEYKTKEKARRVKRDYGITLVEYRKHLETPCDICGDVAKHLDHCHTTGTVRGGLCPRCNHMLGHSRDNIEILKNAIKYLEVSCTQTNT